MARYIDADKLEKHFIESVSKHNLIINGNDYPVFLADHTLHEIRNAPAADVVEVVRCKDCVAGGKATLEPFVCSRNKMLVYNNSYCSYGKRKVTK